MTEFKDVEQASYTPDQDPNRLDVISMAKSMLSIWDQWMNVEAIDRTTERQATDLLKAACFAGQAYEDMIASPLTADAASGVLLRIFLTALIDANSPELDPYRAKNRPQPASPAQAEQWTLHDLKIGKAYESIYFGIVHYAGIDIFHGQQTYHFRTSWRTIHENRYISTDPDHPNNSLNHFLKPKNRPQPATLTNEGTKPIDVAAMREQCAQIAEDFAKRRPLLGTNQTSLTIGRWEGEQAASANIASIIRANFPAASTNEAGE